jgi:hypothetical protein
MNIKELMVEVTYAVSLSDLDLPENIYEGLEAIEYRGVSTADMLRNSWDKEERENISAAFEWLADNIKEGDAHEWSYSINDLQAENEDE